MDWKATIMQPAEAMWASILVFLPKLFVVIAVLLIGWIIAALVQKVMTRFLKLARLDGLSEKVGIANILSKGDINYTLSEIVGVIIYWLLMLIVALAAVNTLELNVAAELLKRVILYIPNVIAGLFILVLGIFLANIIANTVRTAAANAGVQQARFLGQSTYIVIIVFTIVEVLSQLKLDTKILQLLVISVLAAFSLGIGLAIGLGCKDLAGKYIAQLIDSFKAKKQ